MPGACCTRGLVCKKCASKRTRAYRYSRSTPAFPAQWLYGLCRALRRRIRLATVVCGLRFVLARLGRRISARRSISNGCQDHTVLPYAARLHQRPRRVWYPSAEVLAKADSASFVLRAIARSRETALRTHFTRDAAASTASHPNVRDDGQRPSCGMRRRGL